MTPRSCCDCDRETEFAQRRVMPAARLATEAIWSSLRATGGDHLEAARAIGAASGAALAGAAHSIATDPALRTLHLERMVSEFANALELGALRAVEALDDDGGRG